MNYLPDRIKHEVLKFHCMKALKSAPIFDKFSVEFLSLLLDRLDSSFFLSKQTIYEKGECGFELFLLTRGSVDMMDGKNTLMTVRSGQLFGEGEFFKHEPRICGAVAKEFCNAFILHTRDLHELLESDEEHWIVFDEQVIEAADRIDTTAKVEKMKKNLKSGGKMAQMMMLDDNTEEKKDVVYVAWMTSEERSDELFEHPVGGHPNGIFDFWPPDKTP